MFEFPLHVLESDATEGLNGSDPLPIFPSGSSNKWTPAVFVSLVKTDHISISVTHLLSLSLSLTCTHAHTYTHTRTVAHLLLIPPVAPYLFA